MLQILHAYVEFSASVSAPDLLSRLRGFHSKDTPFHSSGKQPATIDLCRHTNSGKKSDASSTCNTIVFLPKELRTQTVLETVN